MSEPHDELLDLCYRFRAAAKLRANAREHVSSRIRTASICRNPALQNIGVRELSEAEQDRHDQRFLVGKYAPKRTHVRISSFYPGAQPEPPAGDPTLVLALREAQLEAQSQMELERRLWGMSSGEHIRLLRTVLLWTQEEAATELGISRRSVIRHEHGQHRRPWMRKSLLKRLRELECKYHEQIAAYLAHR